MQCVTFIIWGCSVDVWYAIGIHGTRSKKICFGQTDKNLTEAFCPKLPLFNKH
jgi:hypothetical protein